MTKIAINNWSVLSLIEHIKEYKDKTSRGFLLHVALYMDYSWVISEAGEVVKEGKTIEELYNYLTKL